MTEIITARYEPCEIGGQQFCEGCLYSDGESCMKIVPPEIIFDKYGQIELCSGLLY